MITYVQSAFDGHWREIDDELPELASHKARPPLANQLEIFVDIIEQALEQDMRGEQDDNHTQTHSNNRAE